MANSDVKLKHKVQLRKKLEEPEVSGNNGSIEPDLTPTPTPNKPKSKNWLWILLGVIVFGVIGYIFFSKSGDKAAETSDQEAEVVVAPSEPTDTTIVEGTEGEEIAPENDNEVANNPETQSSDAVETPATVDNTSNGTPFTTVNVPNVSNDVEAEAMKVIRGDYGIGQERKDKLGSKYQTIQSRVNELKREGIF